MEYDTGAFTDSNGGKVRWQAITFCFGGSSTDIQGLLALLDESVNGRKDVFFKLGNPSTTVATNGGNPDQVKTHEQFLNTGGVFTYLADPTIWSAFITSSKCIEKPSGTSISNTTEVTSARLTVPLMTLSTTSPSATASALSTAAGSTRSWRRSNPLPGAGRRMQRQLTRTRSRQLTPGGKKLPGQCHGRQRKIDHAGDEVHPRWVWAVVE